MAGRGKLLHLRTGTWNKHGCWSSQTDVWHFLPIFNGSQAVKYWRLQYPKKTQNSKQDERKHNIMMKDYVASCSNELCKYWTRLQHRSWTLTPPPINLPFPERKEEYYFSFYTLTGKARPIWMLLLQQGNMGEWRFWPHFNINILKSTTKKKDFPVKVFPVYVRCPLGCLYKPGSPPDEPQALVLMILKEFKQTKFGSTRK